MRITILEIQSILGIVDLGLPQVREELQGCKVQLETIDKEIKLISIKETARKTVIEMICASYR